MITVMFPRRIHSALLRTGLRVSSAGVMSLKTQFTHSLYKFAPGYWFQPGHKSLIRVEQSGLGQYQRGLGWASPIAIVEQASR